MYYVVKLRDYQKVSSYVVKDKTLCNLIMFFADFALPFEHFARLVLDYKVLHLCHLVKYFFTKGGNNLGKI